VEKKAQDRGSVTGCCRRLMFLGELKARKKKTAARLYRSFLVLRSVHTTRVHGPVRSRMSKTSAVNTVV